MWLVDKLCGIKIIHDTQCTPEGKNSNTKMLDHEVKQTVKQYNQIQNGQETDNMSNSHCWLKSLATSSVMTEKISTFNRCCKLAISYDVCDSFRDDTTSSAIERISTFNSCCKIAFCLRFFFQLMDILGGRRRKGSINKKLYEKLRAANVFSSYRFWQKPLLFTINTPFTYYIRALRILLF